MDFYDALLTHPAGMVLAAACWLFVLVYTGILIGPRGLVPAVLFTAMGIGAYFLAISQGNLWSGVGILGLALIVAIPMHTIALLLVLIHSIFRPSLHKTRYRTSAKTLRTAGIVVPLLYFGFLFSQMVSQNIAGDKIALLVDGQMPEVKKVFSSKRTVTAVLDKDQDTPLHIAAYWARYEVVDWLLANGADPNASNADARTPIRELFDNIDYIDSRSGSDIVEETAPAMLMTAMLLVSNGSRLEHEDYSNMMSIPGSDSLGSTIVDLIINSNPFDSASLISLAESAAFYGRPAPLVRIRDRTPAFLRNDSLGRKLFESSLIRGHFDLAEMIINWGVLEGCNCCQLNSSGIAIPGTQCVECCEMLDHNGKLPLNLFKEVERHMGQFFPICPDNPLGLLWHATSDTNRRLVKYLLDNYATSAEFWPVCSTGMESAINDKQLMELYYAWKQRMQL